MTDALSSGLGLEGTLSLAGKMEERQKQAQAKATKQAEAQIISQEGQYSKPAPEFKMTDETASGFAALGALIAASGAILGSNGRSSGIMAMNAVSGMMNGYNSGRKDLYEQKRVEFEENMKKWEKDRQMIKEIFDRALKVAPTNLKLAQDMLNRDLTAIGQKPLAEMAQRSGPMPAAAAFYKADASIKSKVDPLKDLLGTATSGLNSQQKQYYDSLPTNQARMDYLQSVQADVKARKEAIKGEGAAEYGTITYADGSKKTGLFPASKIYDAEDQGGSFVKVTPPSGTGGYKEVTVKDESGKNVIAYLNEQTGEYLKTKENKIATKQPTSTGTQTVEVQVVDPKDNKVKTAYMNKETGEYLKNASGGIAYAPAKGTGAAATNIRFTNNMIRGAGETLRGFEQINDIGLQTTGGVFGGVVNKGTITSAAASSLANALTSEDSRNYNTAVAGLGLEFASVLSGGYRVNQAAIDKLEEAVRAKPGDTLGNVAYKFANGIAKLRTAVEFMETFDEQQAAFKERLLAKLDKYATPEQILQKTGKPRVDTNQLNELAKERYGRSPTPAELDQVRRDVLKKGYIIAERFPSLSQDDIIQEPTSGQ